MQKKIVWIILFSILGLIIIFLGCKYYLRFFDNKITLSNQPQDEEGFGKEFLNFLEKKKGLPLKDEEASLIAVGDISYSRGVERAVKEQKDINYPFLKVGDYFKSADLVFGNLETPITKGREIARLEMIFRSNPGTEEALKKAGFSILSLANNHTPNFGQKGLKDTFNYLEKAGIKYVGAGKNEKEANQPVYLEAKGIKFAFLAYNSSDVVPASYEASETFSGTAFMRKEKMIKAVKEAKQKADFVIVSMHAGNEYVNKPNNSQINFAHEAVDAGADLIIGHHPHVVQTMEKYRGKYIFYSLGNFVFDQMWSQETKEGLIVKVYFTKNGISKISFLPVIIENFAQPRPTNNDEAENILSRLNFPLAKRNVYFWESDNNFGKDVRATIYAETLKNEVVFSKEEQADLDNDSIQEIYTLENGRLTITENAENIWQSPARWWIDDFILADSNNDGVLDINISLWKDEVSVKNHFFIFDFVNGTIKPIWRSSNLKASICEFKVADLDGDGKNDLVVTQGDYSQKPNCKGNYVAVWKWDEQGFSNEWRSQTPYGVWRSEKGNFSNLEIEKIEGENYIIVD